MKIKLIRRWSDHPARAIVDTDDVQGQWLIDNGFGTHEHDTRTHEEVEGALQPTHITGRPSTRRNRAETGVSGAAEGSPDAVHNRVETTPKPRPPAAKPKP